MTTRLESSFRHGMRVRLGSAQLRGVLFHCERKDGSMYWRVRLQSGAWTWPDDLAVDGPGTELAPACASCELPFYRRAGSDELICDRCNFEQFGGRQRFDDTPNRPPDMHRRPGEKPRRRQW